MNRRNIIQFKPEGVANIFAPNIRINGEFISPKNVPSASNDYQMDMNNVSYPRMPTVSIERERIAQQNAQNNNFDKLYMGLFNNLFGENNIPSSNRGENLFGVNGNGPASSDDYASFVSSSLKDHYECLNKNGHCVSKDQCEEDDRIGNCLIEDYVCCKSKGVPPRPYQGFGSSSGNQMAGSNAQGSSVGSSSSSTGGSSASSSTSGSSASSSGSSTSTTEGSNPNSSFCDLNCGRVVKYKKDILDQNGDIIRTETLDKPIYEWRPCTEPCKLNDCSNCQGPNYKNPNDLDGDGLIDEIRATSQMDPELRKQLLKDTKTISIGNRNPSKISKTDLCYNLSENECDSNPNCFTCHSDYQQNDIKCYRNSNDQYICDSKGISACVPIYKNSRGVLDADTAGPFHNSAEYKFYDKEIRDLGNKKTLDYPFKCKGPIKEIITFEDKRDKFMRNNPRSKSIQELLARQKAGQSTF